MNMLDQIAQIGIFTTGVVALYLVGPTDPRQRMRAGIFGLCGEPFWLITALINAQWGVVLLVAIYGYNWWRVFSNNRKLLNEQA